MKPFTFSIGPMVWGINKIKKTKIFFKFVIVHVGHSCPEWPGCLSLCGVVRGNIKRSRLADKQMKNKQTGEGFYSSFNRGGWGGEATSAYMVCSCATQMSYFFEKRKSLNMSHILSNKSLYTWVIFILRLMLKFGCLHSKHLKIKR